MYELMTERKTAFPSFSMALQNVFNNSETLWAEARAESLDSARSSVSLSHMEIRHKTATVPDIDAVNRKLINRNGYVDNE